FLSIPVFFFQAEYGIRDFHVTGVQTCALPISKSISPTLKPRLRVWRSKNGSCQPPKKIALAIHAKRMMSANSASAYNPKRMPLSAEERRVGDERRARALLGG